MGNKVTWNGDFLELSSKDEFLVLKKLFCNAVIVSSLNLVPGVYVQNFLWDLVWVMMDTAVKLGRKRKHSSAYKRGKHIKSSNAKSKVETWFWFAKLNIMF